MSEEIVSQDGIEAKQAGATRPADVLVRMLRRLPRAIRQLRVRQADRPAFRVNDERDLEDLLRSLLPLLYDDVRPECRTASYALGSSTDFVVDAEGLVLIVKRTRADLLGERELAEQLQEDIDYYEGDEGEKGIKTLLCLIYDPEDVLGEPRRQEELWTKSLGTLDVRCVIAT